jgi:hypothetical protein
VQTEASMLGLLEKRYLGDQKGNGPAWAFVPKVRNAAGFDATRTIDALAMSLWPSRGLELHGHEIKVSRSDWLREMKDPAKAEAFARLVDRWWLVVGGDSIVKDGELPPTWGLMVASGRGLRVKVQAPLLPRTDAEWMPRTFLAALLRSATRTQIVTPAEVVEAIAAERAKWDEQQASTIERWRAESDRLGRIVREFEQASGVRLARSEDREWYGSRQPAEVGAALRAVLDGDAETERFTNRCKAMLRNAEQLAADLRRALGEPEAA